MSSRFDKLVTLLRELFQLDQPDLDFGFYRIMHAKSAEVTQFLERDLLPQVKAAFAEYQPADKAAIENELAKAIGQATGLGVDPESTQKVKDLRARLADEAVDLDALEAEVFDHLYRFFRRYYTDGDFLSKRVYKEGVYAIPYAGEEVKLHWANADQYYIKTAEYLRDYAFRLAPNAAKNPMRVHFRLVDAAEGEHGNVKESNKRVFVLAAEDLLAVEDGPDGKELVIRFEYRPATLTDWPEDERAEKKRPPAQKDLVAIAEARILAAKDAALVPWIRALGRPHIKSDGETADYSRLRAHLNRYTARNTFDYFIHKDLGGFLRRELDFYIKNEVMHLDDIESETVPRVEQYLSKIKVIRKIAGKIIAFLAQLEEFQKKLWLKKKFVTETSWCVRLGVIPEEFLAEIAKSDAQREEWVKLHAIDGIEGDLHAPGYGSPLTPEFLKANPTLMVDTRLFDAEFTARLLEAVGDLDEHTDGVLFHSENFQALSLAFRRLSGAIDCAFADPPYNTGTGDFAYKDTYQHSSWLSMMLDRLGRVQSLLADNGVAFQTIDDIEQHRLHAISALVFGPANHLATIVWQKRYVSNSTAQYVSDMHDYVVAFSNHLPSVDVRLQPRTESQLRAYRNPDNDPRGPWRAQDLSASKPYQAGLFEIVTQDGKTVSPPPGRYWRCSRAEYERLLADGRITFGQSGLGRPMVKAFLSEAQDGVVPNTWWTRDEVGDNKGAKLELKALFHPEPPFATPKPCGLIQRCCTLVGASRVLDYFAGSGTTGHAVINLNREDGGRRKFILVEMGDYFDTVLLPRLKKVTYAPEWKDGKPKRFATPEEAERSPRILKVVRLESYEDTLNNLDLHRTRPQEETLFSPEAQGPDGFREQYLLRYMLDVETRGSASLLDTAAFTDPMAYRLKVKRPGSDESREVCVDLIETFHWLIGLTIRHIAAPRAFTASFKRDPDPDLPKDAPRRLLLDGRMKEAPNGRWWFRAIEGELRDGRKTLVIWRNRPGGEEPEGVEQDNLMLDTWFTKQGYSSKDSEFDLIYVNGTNNLENLKAPDDTWKVRLIEDDFHRLMFDVEGA